MIRHEYHVWYASRRWKRLRKLHLQQSPLCVRCQRKGMTRAATEVHHPKAHKGDPLLFWDPNNLESLCHSCHSREAQSEDHLGYNKFAVDDDGWPSDSKHPTNLGGAMPKS